MAGDVTPHRDPRCSVGRAAARSITIRARRGSHGGPAVTFGAADDKNRDVVERAFNQLRNWRVRTTRYDRALVHRGGIVLASMPRALSRHSKHALHRRAVAHDVLAVGAHGH